MCGDDDAATCAPPSKRHVWARLYRWSENASCGWRFHEIVASISIMGPVEGSGAVARVDFGIAQLDDFGDLVLTASDVRFEQVDQRRFVARTQGLDDAD